MKSNGFSAIELLAVVSILAIVFVVALPQYVKAGTEEREAEVKSNIHAIQIALERYAVDSGGIYPTWLIGAERQSNIIKCSIDLSGNGFIRFPVHGMTPFAKTADRANATGPDMIRFTMDPLIQFGYLSEYPVNPFVGRDDGIWNSSSANRTGMTGVFPYGGQYGDLMFDLGFGWGDTPQTDFYLFNTAEVNEENQARHNPAIFSDPDNDAPGNFYYHPIFNDLIPVYFHYAANYGAIHLEMRNMASFGILGDEVAGYFLYGYGASAARDNVDEFGNDYFNRMPTRDNLPDEANVLANFPIGIILDSSVTAQGFKGQERVETTGYPGFEYDPWTGSFADGIDPQDPGQIDEYRKSGPDGVPDWAIIEVTSGVDVKGR